jgi:hypothetical protein
MKVTKEEFKETWNKISSNLLIFSNFVVGGLLASSFIQESLSSDTVGLIGMIVLSSSLIHQKYRPDAIADKAKIKAIKLRSMIRKAEDMLFEHESDETESFTINEIRKFVSRSIAEVEGLDLTEAMENLSKSSR